MMRGLWGFIYNSFWIQMLTCGAMCSSPYLQTFVNIFSTISQAIIFVVYFLQVINPYINCIRAQNNLRVREGRSVFLENTLISDLMYWYGKYPMNHKSNKNTDVVLERVTAYINHHLVWICELLKVYFLLYY